MSDQQVYLNLGRGGAISTIIENARSHPEFTLDRNGNIFYQDQSSCLTTTEFYDSDKIKTQYYPELNQTLAQLLQAEHAVAFVHRVRNADKANEGTTATILNYVPKVHIDYSVAQGKELVHIKS